MWIINNVKFAQAQKQLSATIALSKLARVQEIDSYAGEIKFKLQGALDNLHRPILKLSIYGIISALCQNCMQPLAIKLDSLTVITVFFTEKQLEQALFAAADLGVEDGVLAEDDFNVIQLVEDEVIMLLPYAPKHESCVGLSYHDPIENQFSGLKEII
jgi:uncharacterized protein